MADSNCIDGFILADNNFIYFIYVGSNCIMHFRNQQFFMTSTVAFFIIQFFEFNKEWANEIFVETLEFNIVVVPSIILRN